METSAPIFRFGPYESRPRSRELYKHGAKLKIRQQPLHVLNLLLSRAGDVLTRDELRHQLWSSETFVDFEHSLNTSVKEIRAALGDSAADPRYVETLHKVGYRFIATVEITEPLSIALPIRPLPPAPPALPPPAPVAIDVAIDDPPPLPQVLPSAPTSAHTEILVQSPAQRPSQTWKLLSLIAACLVVALAGYQWFHTRLRPPTHSERMMLAVLPFENLTGDSAQDYFSDGLTEEIIAQLGHADPHRLGIIARTSVMRYKHTQQQLNQIGHDLGVQYVLGGSVRRDSDKVRITEQLIQVKDQTNLWSHEYDRDPSHLLALQREIAEQTAGEIRRALGEESSRTGTSSIGWLRLDCSASLAPAPGPGEGNVVAGNPPAASCRSSM